MALWITKYNANVEGKKSLFKGVIHSDSKKILLPIHLSASFNCSVFWRSRPCLPGPVMPTINSPSSDCNLGNSYGYSFVFLFLFSFLLCLTIISVPPTDQAEHCFTLIQTSHLLTRRALPD